MVDNAKNCKKVKELLVMEFPNLYVFECCTHTLNLCFKGWYKNISWFKDIINEAQEIVKLIRSKQCMVKIYVGMDGSTMLLLVVTRFST